MQLIIKNDTVIATHQDWQTVADLYPGAECIQWPLGSISAQDPDPRTQKQKKDNYKDTRRVAYTTVEDTL